MDRKIVTVVATGVFDILHPGHVFFLSEAKKLGDRLVVIVARDRTAEMRKRKPHISEEQRLSVVSALKVVDLAVLGDEEDYYKPIEKIRPDIVALGRDQHFSEEEIERELEKRGVYAKVVRIKGHVEGDLLGTRRIVERIQKRG